MDLARNLVRTVARSFYSSEYILIIDALVIHSALRDDDLALLLGSQTKHSRKLAFKLREDGLVRIENRQEFKEGSNRPFTRDYYWIDYHRAIDVVKFRLKSMTRRIEAEYGGQPDERKEYVCPRCKSEWTQMEALDEIDGDGNFLCKRCGTVLDMADDSVPGAGSHAPGHEMQSRLNAQLAPLEDLMRQIDSALVPETTWDMALANALPVRRTDLNPRSETAAAQPRLPPATVRGLKVEEKVHVSLIEDDEASREAERAADEERKRKLAQQNALPVWHTVSAVGGRGPVVSRGGDGMNGEIELPKKDAETEETKPAGLEDSSGLDAYFAALKEEQEREAARVKGSSEEEEDDDDDDDDDEEGDDDDDEGFEDVLGNGVEKDSEEDRPSKRVRLEEPSASSELPPEKEDQQNGEEKIIKIKDFAYREEDGKTPKTEPSSESDEDEFEDVK